MIVVEGAPPRIRTDLRGQAKRAVLDEESQQLVANVAAGERCACEYCERIRKEG
ncbi:MAG: hypothetical protein JNL79_13345 [Myxococcales bacterium]|nr:hypothetical protein [Myxococcales bacterium]